MREHPRTYKDDVANFSSSTSISMLLIFHVILQLTY
nr:palindromic element RPE5 domain-containing protein [Rickettsia australis]